MVVVFEVPLEGGGSISEVIGSLQTITYSVHEEKAPVRGLGDMNVKGYVFGPRTIAGSMIFTVFNRHWAKDLMNKYLIAVEKKAHFLVDELPAINVTISCANEYGNSAYLSLFGVTFVNEGQIMSINDNYTENTFEFFATDINYLDDLHKPLTSKSSDSNTAQPNVAALSNAPVATKNLRPVKMDVDAASKDPAKTDTNDYKVKEKNDPFKMNAAYDKLLTGNKAYAQTVIDPKNLKKMDENLYDLSISQANKNESQLDIRKQFDKTKAVKQLAKIEVTKNGGILGTQEEKDYEEN